ncbi:MAG: type II toxin-antitoxin system Phd/YefM family antitoxin [Deltaproteobacteria bacterium]|nr:type II toxin-antitoxin system Phd/YefM family antitoxin [Deltaproteobacteria bacterium]
MKFVSVRDLRGKSAQLWKTLSAEREMIVTSNGRPIAILLREQVCNLLPEFRDYLYTNYLGSSYKLEPA